MKKLNILLFIGLASVQLKAQTKAHEKSAGFILDPAYNSTTYSPQQSASGEKGKWLYGYSEFECWRLEVMRKGGKEAKLLVGYPGEYHEVYTKAGFRLNFKKPGPFQPFRFFSNAAVSVFINGINVHTGKAKDGAHLVNVKQDKPVESIEIRMNTDKEPPCLLIKEGAYTTESAHWRWKAGEEPWQEPAKFAQEKDGSLPHRHELDGVKVKAALLGNLYDFGREIFGYLDITAQREPKIQVGESVAEAIDSVSTVFEQTLEVISLGNNHWRSKVPLAFRYAKVSGADLEVSGTALFYPARYKGAFACSDTLLNRIWMNSAYTLRLCRNDFLMDGVKRDRLPWAGDLAMSLMVNAYTFGDPEPVRKSLVALNRAGISKKDINGIIDYSLWWVISQNQYQLYYKDDVHLKREWARIKETMNIMNSRCDSLGFIDPKKASWLFIDWVEFNKNSSLQILWWWAQKSAVQLANRVGDSGAAKLWAQRADKLKALLLDKVWSTRAAAFMDDPYKPELVSRHANILAVVSGLAGQSNYSGIKNVLKGKQAQAVGTPYMGGFENIALAMLGEREGLVSYISSYWGGMFRETGTSTFWEAYDPSQTGKTAFEYYGRPYAKSLCHAWSSGPAAILPYSLLGIHPVADGWKRFTVDPHPGNLEWISAAIPTPAGLIVVDIVGNKMTLQIPNGLTAVYKGKNLKGPKKLTVELN